MSRLLSSIRTGVLLIGLLLAGQQALDVHGQPFAMVDESTVWIEGTSTVNEFVCSTDEVGGSGRLPSRPGPEDMPPETSSAGTDEIGPPDDASGGPAGSLRPVAAMPDSPDREVVIRVPAHLLDCGLPAMNRDLRESLRVDVQPSIIFRLDRAEVLAKPEQNAGVFLLRAHGRLSMAGAERDVNVLLEGERTADGRLRAWGSKDLRMTDYGIKPPSALFGLVRAHDDITVRFNFIAEPLGTASNR